MRPSSERIISQEFLFLTMLKLRLRRIPLLTLKALNFCMVMYFCAFSHIHVFLSCGVCTSPVRMHFCWNPRSRRINLKHQQWTFQRHYCYWSKPAAQPGSARANTWGVHVQTRLPFCSLCPSASHPEVTSLSFSPPFCVTCARPLRGSVWTLSVVKLKQTKVRATGHNNSKHVLLRSSWEAFWSNSNREIITGQTPPVRQDSTDCLCSWRTHPSTGGKKGYLCWVNTQRIFFMEISKHVAFVKCKPIVLVLKAASSERWWWWWYLIYFHSLFDFVRS